MYSLSIMERQQFNEIKLVDITKIMVSLRKAKLVIFAGGEFCGVGFFVVPSWVDTKKKIWGPVRFSLVQPSLYGDWLL